VLAPRKTLEVRSTRVRHEPNAAYRQIAMRFITDQMNKYIDLSSFPSYK
jgi:hypothetical protein